MGLCSFCFQGLCFNHQKGENGQRKIVGVMLGSQAKTIRFIRHAEGSSLKYEYIPDINRATIKVDRVTALISALIATYYMYLR